MRVKMTRMLVLYFAVCLIGCSIIPARGEEPAAKPTKVDISDWQANVRLGREYLAWQNSLPVRTHEVVYRVEDPFSKLASAAKGRGSEVCHLLAARMGIISGDTETAATLLEGATKCVAVAPEGTIMLIRCVGEDSAEKDEYCADIVGMIPLTPVAVSLGGVRIQYSERPSKLNVPPSVPNLSKDMQSTTAKALESAGDYDLAWRCYAEAGYAGSSIPWPERSLDDSWLSPKAAEYWIKAAECAVLADADDAAWAYLAKAAVCGSPALSERSQSMANRWAEEITVGAQSHTQGIAKADKQMALERVINIFVEMNAHPRALALIDKYRDVLEQADKQREDIVERWRRVLVALSTNTTTVVLFGTQVNPDGINTSVVIPWALEDIAH